MKNSNVEFIKSNLIINDNEAVELDEEIRNYINAELEKMEIGADGLFELLDAKISDKQTSKDVRRRRKAIRSIIGHYQYNYGRLANQNNLFTLLGTIGSIIVMIYQIIDFNHHFDWGNWFIYAVFFILMLCWLFLDNFWKDKNNVRRVLVLINDACAPLFFIFNTLFYLFLGCYYKKNADCGFYVIGILIVLIFIIGVVWLCVERFSKSSKRKRHQWRCVD